MGQREYERPALFLDLDGTVRYSKNGEFINSVEDVAVYEDVEELLWVYKQSGWLIFGITNQGGVAFGYKTSEDVLLENGETNYLLNFVFDKIFWCPFHPDAPDTYKDYHSNPYKLDADCRKPKVGMIEEAILWAKGQYFIVDREYSVLVGDREEDQQCAENARLSFVWADDFFERKEREEKTE